MVFLQCIPAPYVVPSDLRRDLGRLVLEETVKLRFAVVHEIVFADSLQTGLMHAVIEGLLSDMVQFPGLIDGEIVLLNVTADEFSLVPTLLMDKQSPSLAAAGDPAPSVLLRHTIRQDCSVS